MQNKNFWSPYIAGVGVGLALLAAFYVVGWGLAASSAFSLLAGVGVREINPAYANTLKYFARYLNTKDPLLNWYLFEVGGLFLGALAGSLLSGNFRMKLDKAAGMNNGARLLTAFAGGLLIGFASRLSRGCTSGVGLSGGAQLALSGWIFVISLFASGFVTAAFFRRLWR